MKRAQRHWEPCRVCGVAHENPASSSICPTCGALERRIRELKEEKAHAERERERSYLPASYRIVDALTERLGPDVGKLIKELIEAVVGERACDSSPDREYD